MRKIETQGGAILCVSDDIIYFDINEYNWSN